MKYVKRSTHVKPVYDAAVKAEKPQKKRPAPVSMRFNEAQLAGLKSYAGNQSVGVYCRDYLLKSHNLGAGGAKPGLFQDQIVAAQILRELGLSGVSENLRFIKDTLGDTIGLPSVEQAQKMVAQHVTERLAELRREQATESVLNRAYARRESERAEQTYQRQQESLWKRQTRQKEQQEHQRAARLRGGVFGLWDRLTGRHKKTLLLNQSEQQTMRAQQAKEMRTLRDQHLTKVKAQQDEARLARSKHYEAMKELRQDMTRLREPPKEMQRQKRKERSSRRRSRSRDGPRLER